MWVKSVENLNSHLITTMAKEIDSPSLSARDSNLEEWKDVRDLMTDLSQTSDSNFCHQESENIPARISF